MEKLMLKECENCADWNGNLGNCIEICGLPFDALQEFNEYRKIGTVDECRAAIEKQIPKKIRFKAQNPVYVPYCPNCGETYCDCSGNENYCKNCCQKWEWGD